MIALGCVFAFSIKSVGLFGIRLMIVKTIVEVISRSIVSETRWWTNGCTK